MNLLQSDKVAKYVLGGKAILTIGTNKSKDNFERTFRIRKKHNEKYKNPVYFVSYLSGRCNETNYTYLGFLKENLSFTVSKKFNSSDSRVLSLFEFSLKLMTNLEYQKTSSKFIKFYHNGRCSRCNRLLTKSISIERGMGAYCFSKK